MNETDRNVLHRDAEDVTYFLVAQAFEPKENETAVKQAERAYSGVELTGLQSLVAYILKRIDVDSQTHRVYTTFAALLLIKEVFRLTRYIHVLMSDLPSNES